MFEFIKDDFLSVGLFFSKIVLLCCSILFLVNFSVLYIVRLLQSHEI